MARTKDGFIGIRVPIPTKESWERQAADDDRSLSNWIQRRVEKGGPPSSERPAKGRKTLAR